MRLWFRLVALTLALAATAAGAQNSSLFEIRKPTASGSFLAGQQAIRDMRPEDAARYFMDAAEVEWDNPAIVERAFGALAADGRIDDAAALAQHLVELEPSNDLARLVLATIALKERRYPSALAQLEHVEQSSFVGITATILKAWALVADDRSGEAYAVMDAMAESGLEDFLLFHRTLMADVAGDREQAIAYAQAAYDIDPYVATVVEAYTRILGNASRFDEARAVIEDYREQGASHPIVDVVAEAVEAGVRPGKMAPSAQAGAAEMFHGIGAALARDGSSDIALVFLRLGLYLNPADDVTTMSVAQIYENSGRYERANDLYDGLASASPLQSIAVVRIAENLNAMGRRDEAIRRLNNIAVSQPDNFEAVAVLGDLYRYEERYEESIEAYSRVLDVVGGEHPGDWRYYYVRGISNERAGHWDAAEADFKKALELNPGQPQVLNYLGYSWVDKGLNLHEALDMIREAVNSSPTDGYIVDSLGWAYYKLGRIEDAVKTLEQAVSLQPDDPEINDHLGDAYWAAGRKVEARFQWTIAVDVDENGTVAERAGVKLANGLDGPGDANGTAASGSGE